MKFKSLLSQHPELLARLGTESDLVLAREYGVTRQRIHQIRTQHRIPSRWEADKIQRYSSYLPLLGLLPDLYLARLFGASLDQVRRDRIRNHLPPAQDFRLSPDQEQEITSLLGKISDAQIASQADCPVITVWRLRRNAGIPPVREKGYRVSRLRILELLDQGLDDAQVALQIPCNPTLVSQTRKMYRGKRSRRFCSPEQKTRAIEAMKAGKSPVQVAADLHVPLAFIDSWRRKEQRTRKFVPDEILLGLFQQGLSPRKMARLLDLHPATVRRRLIRLSQNGKLPEDTSWIIHLLHEIQKGRFRKVLRETDRVFSQWVQGENVEACQQHLPFFSPDEFPLGLLLVLARILAPVRDRIPGYPEWKEAVILWIRNHPERAEDEALLVELLEPGDSP